MTPDSDTPTRIYFDHAATTPLDPRVHSAMDAVLSGGLANPSSLHAEGRAARAAVEAARTAVMELVGATGGVVFTSGGTEADNLALIGTALSDGPHPPHVITSAIEHPAITATCRWLATRCGVAVTTLPVTADGLVEPAVLADALRPETRLVSIMAANNVVGTLQPIRALAAVAHEHGALFHTDAVQAVGRVPIDMARDGIDLLSLSAHKFHGPTGIGALAFNTGVVLDPVLHGGGQERGLRSGTENLPGIVCLGAAARIAMESREADAPRLVRLRDRLIDGVLGAIPNAYLIGHRYRRLPGHACFGFAGLEGEAIKLMLALDEADVAVSTGSACSAHKAQEPSSVLTAMGYDPFRARGALRVTLGRFNTDDEVDRFLALLPEVVRRLRPITTRSAEPTRRFNNTRQQECAEHGSNA